MTATEIICELVEISRILNRLIDGLDALGLHAGGYDDPIDKAWQMVDELILTVAGVPKSTYDRDKHLLDDLQQGDCSAVNDLPADSYFRTDCWGEYIVRVRNGDMSVAELIAEAEAEQVRIKVVQNVPKDHLLEAIEDSMNHYKFVLNAVTDLRDRIKERQSDTPPTENDG